MLTARRTPRIQPLRDELHPNRLLDEKHREILEARARNAIFFRTPVTRQSTPVSTPRVEANTNNQQDVAISVDSSCCKCTIM